MSLMAMVLIGTLVFALTGNLSELSFVNDFRFSIGGKHELISDESIDSDGISLIDMDLSSADVELFLSDDSQFHIVYYGPTEEKSDPDITAHTDTDSLIIKQRNRVVPFRLNTNRLVKVYVPSDFNGSFELRCASGDLRIKDDLQFELFLYKVASGDLYAENLHTEETEINTTSGDISVAKLETDEYVLKTSSGDIRIENIRGSGSISVISGDVRIDEYSGSGSISASSGRISVQTTEITGDLDIKVVSGDVEVCFAEDQALILDASVTSGDIDTRLSLDNAKMAKRSLSGTIGDSPMHKLTIRTTSGDIRIDCK